jgi:uncharacterized protein YkwD
MRSTSSALVNLARAGLVAALLISLTTGARAAAKHRSHEVAFTAAINRVRVAHGLPKLTTEPALAAAAQEHSDDMLAGGYFAHGAWEQRLAAHGVGGPNLYIGENLGWCGPPGCPDGSPAAVMRAWLRSPDHRANLLNPAFRHLGVGVAVGRFEGWDAALVISTDFDG